MPRFTRRLGRLAGVLAALVVLGLAVVHLPPVRSRVLDRGRAYAEREFGVALRASSLRYNLITRSIDLQNVSLASASGADPFLEADRLRVVLGSGILLGRFTVDRISLDRPRLTLVRNADGTMNLPASRDGGDQQSPLQLGTVTVRALSARLDDRLARRSFTIGPIDLSIDTANVSTRPGAFGPGAFTLRSGQVETSGTIGGRLAFDGTRVRIEELTAETGEGRIVLTGWADAIGERPAVSARAAVTANLPGAARLMDVDAQGLAGHVEATIDVAGPLAAPALALAVKSRDASYAPLGRIQLAGRSTFGEGRLGIETLAIDSTAGSVDVRGAVVLGEPVPQRAGTPSRLALRWSNLRLDDLMVAAGRSPRLRSGTLAHGSATVDFDARDLSARRWSRLHAAATATFQTSAEASRPESLGLSGRADLRLDRGRWSLRHSIQSRRLQGDLAGDVHGRLQDDASGPRSTLGGSTQLRVADVGALPSLIRAAGVRVPSDVTDGLAGSMRATVDLAGTIANPDARVSLAVRDLKTQVTPHAGALDARLAVDMRGVRVEQLHATAGATALRGSGRYSWRGDVDARVEATQEELSEIARQFRLPVTLGGSARLEGTFSGTGQNVRGVLALSAREVAVDRIAIGPVTADGTVTLEDAGVMTVTAAAPLLGARAQLEIVNRAGYPVSGEVTLDNNDVGALIPAQYRADVGDLSGRLSATARGAGLLTEPAGIRGRLGLRALDVTARGTRLALAAPASITLAHDRVAVDSLDLRVGQHSRVTAIGQLGVTSLPDPLRLHLDGPMSELIDIASRTIETAPVVVRSDGSATLDVTIAGTLGHPQPAGSLTVRSSSLQYGTLAPVTDLTLDATIDPTLITLSKLSARWQGATLGADGAVPWRVVLKPVRLEKQPSSLLAGWLNALPAEPARGKVTVRASDVTQAVLKDVVSPEQLESMAGVAAATVAIEADALSLERIEATAVLDHASLTLAGVRFDQNLPTRLRLENGRARIEHFEWTAEGNPLRASGGMDLAAARPSLDLGASGVLDLRVLGAFVPGAAAVGTADAALTLSGPIDDPVIVGSLTVANADLQLDSPRIAVTDLEGTIRIGANRKADVALAGQLNTGTAKIEGTLDVAELFAPIGTLQFTGRGIALEYPSGLQTESNLSLALALGRTDSTLKGRIDVLSGAYREPLVLTTQLLRRSPTDGIARAAPAADWTTRMRLDVGVATADDVHVENNYGRLDVGAAFRVVGTVASPGVIGRLQAAEDGEIFFGGNNYRIERLTIDLAGARAITPEVNFSARTRVGNVPIGVDLRCPAVGPCERTVRSLVSGVDDKEAEALLFGTGGGVASAGEGLARLVSGELLGVVGRTVGLDAVRLEQEADRRDIFDDPTLISGDVDPAARLTLAKRLGSNVELVYSQNLADDGFTWITSYFGPYGLSLRALVLDDQSRAFEFRHEPPFGAARTRQRQRPGPRVAALRITGTPGFPENEIRRRLELADGDRFTFGDWQRDRDRLERFYHEREFLEVRIRARRLQDGQAEAQDPDEPVKADAAVTLEYAITRGPTTRLTIRGAELPDEVRERITERWTSAMFDAFLERDAQAIVRDHLYGKGYVHATVAARVELDGSRQVKTLTVDVVPGSVVSRRIEIAGNSELPTEQLLQVVPADTLACWLDAPSVERLLENHYRSEGFLAAAVTLSAPENRNGTSVVTIQVVEGPPYSIGAIELTGLPEDLVHEAPDLLALSRGERYQPAAVSAAVDRVQGRLRRAAFRQAGVAADTQVDAKAGRVDITLNVTPGARSVLRDVVVTGADADDRAVADAIVLEPGAPLDVRAIGETRRRLYDLDVYRSVDIQIQPLGSATSPAAPDAPAEQPVVAQIGLEERPRYRFRYGLAINDEQVGPDERDRRLGFAADLENRNVFGSGATTGLSVRLRRNQQVGRVTLGANRFFGLPIRSTLFVSRERELLDPEGAFPITADITSLTAEQAYRFQRKIEWRYGYGIERNHTFIRSQEIDPFDLTVTIARFTTSGLVDRRDDAFNPARGWFVASTLELSTPGVGSDLRFLKDFTQHSYFVTLGKGLVLASGARLGLARTFGDEVLVPSERFFAGGATSVRGYREDDLGERSILDDAEGGSALLVLNGELRFPIYRWLKGVGFVDAGNVYPKVSEISFGDLLIGIGAGARFDTPVGLIRLDLGVPVNRRSFDPRWRFHFGLGHTF